MRAAALLLAPLLLLAACDNSEGRTDTPSPTPTSEVASVATATSTPTTVPIPDPPRLSLEPGIYIGPQAIEVTADPGAEVRYTLDGSDPASDGALVYETPIEATGDTTIRVAARFPGGEYSQVTEGRYRIYAERIDLDEPITLAGDDVLTFEDAYVVHRGDIRLRDNAQLVLRDSMLLHDKDHAFQYELVAEGNARVVVERSGIGSVCNGAFNWAFFDQSSLHAEGMDPTFAQCNTWNFLSGSSQVQVTGWDTFSATICDGSTVAVHRSNTLELEFCLSQYVTIDTTLPATIEGEWVFDAEDDPGARYSLTVTDSEVDGWGINVVPGTDLTIRDGGAVTIGIIVGLPWDNLTVEVEGLRIGHYDDHTWQIGDSRLRLVNTEVYGWEPNVFHNNTLVIRDSDYTQSVINSGTAHYEIEGSRLQHLAAIERVTMTVRNSTITGDVVANEDSHIVLIDSQVKADAQGNLGNIYAKDNARITLRNTTVEGQRLTEANGQIIEE